MLYRVVSVWYFWDIYVSKLLQSRLFNNALESVSTRDQDTRAVKNGPRNVKTTLLQPLIDNLLYPTKTKGTKSKLDNRLLTLTTQ